MGIEKLVQIGWYKVYTLTTRDAHERERWIRKIKSHSQKRNAASCDLAGGISPNDLTQIIRDLAAQREQFDACVKENRPEYLPKE
jgi:hypothetical protein